MLSISLTFIAATHLEAIKPKELAPAPQEILEIRSSLLLRFPFIVSEATLPIAPTTAVPTKFNPGQAAIPPPTAAAI